MSRAGLSFVARAARPALRPAARPAARPAPFARNASSHAADPHAAAEHYPQEGFNAPFWRHLSLGAIALFIYLRVAPSDLPEQLEHAAEERAPWLTRYIAHNLAPDADKFRERNEKHLELAKLAADDKLLFQEAERPRVRRLRYLGTFDQASPNNIPVGSQADLSDLVIKSEKDDFAA
ncbi:hypothetical protein Rhopal_004160-T1 [Rhodotorula paludigena]|uniref:Uncharacterized protein n=1 Tax=Rhodotorula paludigena TaxID=86838 RepID=A0AAV5GNR8_9BASI|nr:hypothetical protein Rhopal_004160-T1 [Rhodotorula paludigena]